MIVLSALTAMVALPNRIRAFAGGFAKQAKKRKPRFEQLERRDLLSVNFVQQPDTDHPPDAGINQAFGYDCLSANCEPNFSTAHSDSFSARGVGSVERTIENRHVFACPVDIHRIVFSMSADSFSSENFDHSGFYMVQSKTATSDWTTVPGSSSSFSGGSGNTSIASGIVTLDVSLNRVTELQAVANASGGEGSVGGGESNRGGNVKVFEIGAFGELPVATGGGLNGLGNNNRSGAATLVLQFDQAVTVKSVNSLKIFNHTTGLAVDISSATLTNNGTTEVTWNLSGVTLPDGYYTAELPATEGTCNTTHSFLFHVLAGDSSGNALVDFADFAELANNFGTVNGPIYGPGDLNGDGHVIIISDFFILKDNFNHILTLPTMDFGDAPEAGTSFPTTLANDGARHILGSGLFLGAGIDVEADGQPDAAAAGDDNAGDDEDGVTFAALQAGSNASLVVTATVPSGGVLNAWIDFNADGDWDDTGEQIFVDQALTNGANNLTVSIPSDASVGPTFVRFRVTGNAGYSFVGLAPDGEVEDYVVTIVAASSSSAGRGLPSPMIDFSTGSTTNESGLTGKSSPTSSSVTPPPTEVVDLAIGALAGQLRLLEVLEKDPWLNEKLVDQLMEGGEVHLLSGIAELLGSTVR